MLLTQPCCPNINPPSCTLNGASCCDCNPPAVTAVRIDRHEKSHAESELDARIRSLGDAAVQADKDGDDSELSFDAPWALRLAGCFDVPARAVRRRMTAGGFK